MQYKYTVDTDGGLQKTFNCLIKAARWGKLACIKEYQIRDNITGKRVGAGDGRARTK